MKIKNRNLAGQSFSRGPKQVYQGDAEGVFDLPDELAEILLGSAGWELPPKREPEKAAPKAPEPIAKPTPKPPPPKPASPKFVDPGNPPIEEESGVTTLPELPDPPKPKPRKPRRGSR